MTEENSVEIPAEAPAAPVDTTPVAVEPKKKGSALKIVGIVAAVVVVLIGAVLGYGFWNGSQIRKYATDSEAIFGVTTVWDNAFDETDTTKIKENVTEIKTESEKALTTLNAKAAPGKAKKLKADMIEYFTISRKVAVYAEGIVDWVAEIEKITKSFTAMSNLDTSTPEAMGVSIDKAKTDIDASVVSMEKIAVPEGLKTQHDAFLKMMRDMSVMYGKLSVALKANDLNALTTISSEFATSTAALDSIDDPKTTIDAAYKKESDNIDSLDKSIRDAIASLKNTGFSF
jgi:flagellar basal body-associated protein FliL